MKRLPLGRLLLVVIAMFVALNLILGLAERRGISGPVELYGLESFAAAHPGWSEDDLRALNEESFGEHLPLRYHPFAAYRTAATTGRFVNVAPAGFRRHRELPWPPPQESCSILLFGGSTAFGLALSDAEGLGAALDDEIGRAGLACPVYNFSVPAHFSSNEQGLFLDLVREGASPSLAIFVDGVNEFFYPDGRPEMYYALEHAMSAKRKWDLLYALPVARWLQAAKVSLRGRREAAAASPSLERETAERVARRWRRNVEMTAGAATARGIATLFVVQPSPAYRYDLRHHLFAQGDATKLGRHGAAAAGYEALAAMGFAASQGEPRVLWLADLQRDRRENLYVDMIHYTAAFSRDIARAIAGAAAPSLAARPSR